MKKLLLVIKGTIVIMIAVIGLLVYILCKSAIDENVNFQKTEDIEENKILCIKVDRKATMDEIKEERVNEVLQAYEEFIAGERKIAGWHIDKLAIPTGEPDSRYRTIYAITDSVRDGIPNLHVRTSRVFLIFSYKEGEFYAALTSESARTYYYVLKDGAFIKYVAFTGEDFFEYFMLDSMGKKINRMSFRIKHSEEREYYINEVRCTKEEWEEKTGKYLTMDEDGWLLEIKNQVDWNVYCEAR